MLSAAYLSFHFNGPLMIILSLGAIQKQPWIAQPTYFFFLIISTLLSADAITKTVSKHTIEECRNDFETIREEILVAVKALFDKEFIYKVAINEIKFQ